MKRQKILLTDELILKYSKSKTKKYNKNLFCIFILVGFVAFSMIGVNKLKSLDVNNHGEFGYVNMPLASVSGKTSVINIPSGMVKANPFVPYRSLGDEPKTTLVEDVPKYDLIVPPDFEGQNPEITKMLDTVVSGILYDKHSPSAILNIDGNDYLVKKGDTIHNYKIVSIEQNSVTVQLGKNTYKAGIGEILSDGSINHNHVSNLDKKFGGEKR